MLSTSPLVPLLLRKNSFGNDEEDNEDEDEDENTKQEENECKDEEEGGHSARNGTVVTVGSRG